MFYCAVCCCLHHPAVNDISVSLGLSVECVNKRMNERILFVLCSQRVHIHAICNSLCLSVLLASSFLCSLGVCISQCGQYVVTGMHYISVLYATRFRPAYPRGVSWSSSRSSSTNWSGLYCITCTRVQELWVLNTLRLSLPVRPCLSLMPVHCVFTGRIAHSQQIRHLWMWIIFELRFFPPTFLIFRQPQVPSRSVLQSKH